MGTFVVVVYYNFAMIRLHHRNELSTFVIVMYSTNVHEIPHHLNERGPFVEMVVY